MKIDIKKIIFFRGKWFIINNNPYELAKRYIYKREFFWKKVVSSCNLDKVHEIEVYSIAFNNHTLIEYQIKTFLKYIQDDFLLIIVDNSNNTEEAKKIEGVAKKNKCWYIKLPKNKLKGSRSHITALNYTRKNFISKRNCKIFWLIDHDIFPIHTYSIKEAIGEQDFYGELVDKKFRKPAGKAWMLPPRFAFFKKEKIKKFNFALKKSIFPPYVLDTGGSMYTLLYKKYKKDTLRFAKSEYTFEKFGKFTDRFQYLENKKRFHITNAASALCIESQKEMVEMKINYSFNKIDNLIKN